MSGFVAIGAFLMSLLPPAGNFNVDAVARMICAEGCNQPYSTQVGMAYIAMSAAFNAGHGYDGATKIDGYLSSYRAALNEVPYFVRIYFGEATPYSQTTRNAVNAAYQLIQAYGVTSLYHFDDCKQAEQVVLITGNRVRWKNGLYSFKTSSDASMCLFAKTENQVYAFIELVN